MLVPASGYALCQMAESKNTTIAQLLLGYSIPITNAEFEIYNTYLRAKQRLDWQHEKGIS